jgi:ribosomal protein S18 acetylase RimI-like enzyme
LRNPLNQRPYSKPRTVRTAVKNRNPLFFPLLPADSGDRRLASAAAPYTPAAFPRIMRAMLPVAVAALDPAAFARSLDRLAEILMACVHEGASVGFVMPFGLDEARAYWREKVAPPHAAGGRLVLAASLGDEIAGTAQLDLDSMPSKRHHAEVSKVLVDPKFRRAGVARALMAEIERRASENGRWLLTLDTAGDAAEALYRSLDYKLAGEIPSYARDAFAARYDATRMMYKDLRGG